MAMTLCVNSIGHYQSCCMLLDSCRNPANFCFILCLPVGQRMLYGTSLMTLFFSKEVKQHTFGISFPWGRFYHSTLSFIPWDGKCEVAERKEKRRETENSMIECQSPFRAIARSTWSMSYISYSLSPASCVWYAGRLRERCKRFPAYGLSAKRYAFPRVTVNRMLTRILLSYSWPTCQRKRPWVKILASFSSMVDW